MASNAPLCPEEHQSIPPEELEEMKSFLVEGPFSDVVDKLKKFLETIENVKLNIAITGESGTGKSTFVNAIRGLGDDVEGSAPTGNVQTTMIPKEYLHPTFKNVSFWDLPGIGTPEFKPETYLKQVNFSRYDFFIIINSGRFTCHEAQLAREIKKMKKNFYFVRSKIDNDMRAAKRSRGAAYDEQTEVLQMKTYCLTSMAKEGIKSVPLFFVSSFDLQKYDFELLTNTLAKNLTDNKRHVFLLSLPNFSLSFLEKKKVELKKDIWKLAFKSCALAAVPIPGLSIVTDLYILKTALTRYIYCFGLDKNSLQTLAEKVGKSLDSIKEGLKSPIDEEISTSMIVKLLTNTVGSTIMFAEFCSKTFPIIGSLTGGATSFATTRYMLNTFLDDLAEDAQTVLERALLWSEK